jgi:hypothetical protein
MNQGPRWTLLMKKTRAVKSRATVPLSLASFQTAKFYFEKTKYERIIQIWDNLATWAVFLFSGFCVQKMKDENYMPI